MTRMLPVVLMLLACAPASSDAKSPKAEAVPEGQAQAVFAGGCFWCMEKPFEKIEGVSVVESGYTGGQLVGPTYEQVSSHATQHIEAIRVVYDPAVVSYDDLLSAFWHNVDPTQSNGQFCDRGHQYTTAVFYGSEAEKKKAEKSKAKAARTLDAEVVTDIREAATFWVAEDYHQDFYKTHTERYESYRLACGRDARLRELWGDKAGH